MPRTLLNRARLRALLVPVQDLVRNLPWAKRQNVLPVLMVLQSCETRSNNVLVSLASPTTDTHFPDSGMVLMMAMVISLSVDRPRSFRRPDRPISAKKA